MRLLLAEDDRQLRAAIVRGLREASYAVDQAGTGPQALALAAANEYDAIILDILLPGKSGLVVCRAIRARESEVPILMLTALDSVEQRIAGLDAGADDYLTKPFGVGELMARLRVALRHGVARAGGAAEPAFAVGELKVDLPARRVSVGGREAKLTPIEYRLLAALVKHAGMVVTHRQLLREVWGPAYVEHAHTLRVHMAALRRKLEADPAQPRYLLTEIGVGYRLAAD
jgi:two-component system KDP operon response regulator KdpE